MPPAITYEHIIRRAQAKINDHGRRIASAPHPFRATWWPSEPTFEQELLSDHGVRAAIPQVEEEFRAEVRAIREALSDSGHTPQLAGWQKGANGAARRMMSSLNLQADALGAWDEIGVPVRRLGDAVVRILAPRDVMGSPITNAIDIDEYVVGVAAKTADDAATIAVLRKRLRSWQTATAIVASLLVLVTWALI